MPHTVEDGRINRLSVSQVEKFDPVSSVWGCNRRWWFRYVARLEEPQTVSQAEGIRLHEQIEHYLKTGQDVLGPLACSGRSFIPAPGSGLLVEHEIPEGTLKALGIPFAGRIDVVNLRDLRQTEDGTEGEIELVDWKTTSNLKYAKTEEQLRSSVQMSGYAKWGMDTYKTESARLTHGVFQTKSTGSRRISCTVDYETVTYNWRRVEGVVGEMVGVAKEVDVSKIPANTSACRVGRFECPFLKRCPRSGGNAFMDLLSRFSPSAPAASAPPPTVSVLPPDAPKSDPKLAADPVPGFSPQPAPQAPSATAATQSPVVAGEPKPPSAPTSGSTGIVAEPEKPKRGPGRPRKHPPITDESKGDDAALRAVHAAKTQPAAPAKEAAPSAFSFVPEKITIRHGMKVGLPNYSSADFQVEISGQVAGSLEDALKSVCEKVDAELKRQVTQFEAKPA